LFLTAFAVAKLVADALGRVQHVYLIGMDFSIDSGFSSKVETKFIPALDTARVAGIEMQQHFLQNALYMLGESSLIATHVGRMSFSGITPTGLNFELGSRRPEDNRAIQTEQEVLVTAEITTNHFGDRTRLERLIREAKAAGADFVKFQKRDVLTFYTAEQLEKPYASPFGTTFGDYRAALELDMEDFDFIDRLCTEVEIGWFLSVLDAPSFEFVKNLNPAMIKLPSTISEHKDYLELVAREYSGPLVLSTGMTDQTYEKWVLETFASQEKIYLLHANSAYPTPEHHCNIGVIRHYTKLSELHPQIIPGWSSHDPGWLGSALAVAAGARMIEKHVKLGNTPWAHFDAVALDLSTNEFKEYVSSIRRAQTIVGTSTKKVTESEHHKYRIPAN